MSLWNSAKKWLRPKGEKPVPDALRRQGELAYSFVLQGNCLAARDLLLRVLEQRSKIRDAGFLDWLLELLAWTWTVNEQYRDAVFFFSKHTADYGRDVRAYTLRACALWYAGDLEESLNAYSKALELDSTDILAHMGRGQVFAELQEYSKAADDLDFALEHLEQLGRPDPFWKTEIQAYSLNGRAVAHAGLGDFDRAFSEFDRSISLCPENAWVYFNRAAVYEIRGKLDEAAADYKLSLQKAFPKLTPLKRKYAELKLKTIAT